MQCKQIWYIDPWEQELAEGRGWNSLSCERAQKTELHCSLRLVKSQRIVHLAPNKISILFLPLSLSFPLATPLLLSFCCRFSIYAHSLACSICQLHADVTPPRAAHLPAMATTCPALAPCTCPCPYLGQHKSQSILHNAMRAWLNGGVAP